MKPPHVLPGAPPPLKQIEFRFYHRETIYCGECGELLMWEKRPDVKDSWMLVHSGADYCSRKDKRFYAPGIDLTELTIKRV